MAAKERKKRKKVKKTSSFLDAFYLPGYGFFGRANPLGEPLSSCCTSSNGLVPVAMALCMFGAACFASSAPMSEIRNGSFELGLTRGDWGMVSGGGGPILAQSNIDGKTASHGSKSLRIACGRAVYTAPFTPAKAGEYRVRLTLKSDVKADVTILLASEAVKPETTIHIATFGSKTFDITGEWKTYEANFSLSRMKCMMRISTSPGDGNVWIDGVSIVLVDSADKPDIGLGNSDDSLSALGDEFALEAPEPVTSYTPRSLLEAGLFCPFPGKIYYVEDGVSFKGHLSNYGKEKGDATLVYEVKDICGRIVEQGEKPGLSASGGKTSEFDMSIADHPRGLFSLRYWLKEAPKNIGEVVYTVIPRPAEDTILGGCSHSSKQIMEVFQRAGIRHFYALTDGWLRPENFCPGGPENYVWFDDLAALPSEYGVETHGVMWHSRLKSKNHAGWEASDVVPVDPPMVGRKRYATNFTYIAHDVWREHVRRVATHYKPWIKGWTIDDEVNSAATAGEYLRVMKDTKEVLGEVDPDMKMAVSAGVHWFEEVRDLGGIDYFDAIAGSIGSVGYWECRKTGWFADKYGKEVWECAMIKYGSSFYHTHIEDGNWLSRARSPYVSLSRCFFLQHSLYVTPYIFRLTAFSTTVGMPKSMLDYDAGLKSSGFGFVMAGVLFSLWERTLTQPDLPAIQPNWYAFTFRFKGRPGVFIYGYSKRLHFPIASGKVETFDWCGNPAPRGEPVSDGMVFSESDGSIPFHVLGKDGVTDEEFFGAVDRMSLLREGMETNTLYLSRNGKVVLATVETDFDGGKGRILATEKVRFNPKRPLEDRRGPWLLNVPGLATTPVLDGNLDEWSWRSGGTMNVEWHGMAPVARSSFHVVKGGEFVRYDSWNDLKIRFYAACNKTDLYLAAFVNDDDVAPPETQKDGIMDSVEFRFDMDILGDLGTDFGSDDDYIVRATLKSPDEVVAELLHTGEKKHLDAVVARHERGYAMEIKVPLSYLGNMKPELNRIVGLDVYLSDADYDREYTGEERFKPEHTILRWAAGKPVGQMIFCPVMTQSSF